jgi:UDP-N-acetylglucosamine/UDP-N-acetylgalactosamine 4-epimerase
MRFLVTGGAGFIGSHITQHLLTEGHMVRVLDNFYSGKMENLSFTRAPGIAGRFELVRGDIRDKEACLKACDSMEYVLHQAALRSVPKSMKEPESYNDVNINGTLNMLQAAAHHKVKRFVLASSSSVYGDVSRFPEREDFYPELISPYALSKLAGEYYCRIFAQSFGVECACLRYFNVFGPRQSLDDEYAVVIPKFIHSILNDRQPPIFGTGKQSRDFTYIDNVVRANVLAATRPGIRYGIFNVANGRDTTVLRIVELLNKMLGKKIAPQFLPLRQGDVFKTLADISRIRKSLGYVPAVPFEEGLRRTVEWFRQQEPKK